MVKVTDLELTLERDTRSCVNCVHFRHWNSIYGDPLEPSDSGQCYHQDVDEDSRCFVNFHTTCELFKGVNSVSETITVDSIESNITDEDFVNLNKDSVQSLVDSMYTSQTEVDKYYKKSLRESLMRNINTPLSEDFVQESLKEIELDNFKKNRGRFGIESNSKMQSQRPFEKNMKTEVVHSLTKNAFNVVNRQLGGKYKIARVPYEVVPGESLISENNKVEAFKHATFISNAFNNTNNLL